MKKEQQYGKKKRMSDDIEWGKVMYVVIMLGCLIGGGILTYTYRMTAIDVHNAYHNQIDVSERYIYTAENVHNSTLIANRLTLSLNALANLSGNYDWKCWWEPNKVIKPDSDFDSIKASLQDAITTAQSYNGALINGTDYTAMNTSLENIIYDMDTANNITTFEEWNANNNVWIGIVPLAIGIIMIIIILFVIFG